MSMTQEIASAFVTYSIYLFVTFYITIAYLFDINSFDTKLKIGTKLYAFSNTKKPLIAFFFTPTSNSIAIEVK